MDKILIFSLSYKKAHWIQEIRAISTVPTFQGVRIYHSLKICKLHGERTANYKT